MKLKQHLKYSGYACLDPAKPFAIYDALDYLKSQNKFYKDISVVDSWMVTGMMTSHPPIT